MRIAQVAPLSESVPPKYDGGTERVVSYDLALIRQDRDVAVHVVERDGPLEVVVMK